MSGSDCHREVLRTLRSEGPKALLPLTLLLPDHPVGDITTALRQLEQDGLVYSEAIDDTQRRWVAYPATVRQGKVDRMTTADRVRLGRRISRAREAAGMRPSELAAALGVSRTAVHLWERGEREPSLSRLREIADAVGAEFAELAR